jgi:ferredoxin
MAMHKVTILHKNVTESHEIRHGLGLQAIEKHCACLEYDCRKADCGICVIRIKEGGENLSAIGKAEADFLKAMHAAPDERLACQCRVFGPISFEVEDYS